MEHLKNGGLFEIDSVPHFKFQKEAKLSTTAGIEPAIFGFEVRRLIHWATRPRKDG